MPKPPNLLKHWQINCLFVLTFLFLLLIATRLFKLQILEHNKFTALAEKQHWGYVEIPAARGRIFSSDGFPLVGNQAAYLVYAKPAKVKDTKKLAEALSPILIEDQPELVLALGQDLAWVPLAHKVLPETKQRIEDLGIEGIGFEEEPERFYPEGTLAAHLLGFVGSNKEGQEEGYYGLEGFYNGDLRGRPGKIIEEKDALGQPILLGGYQKIPAENGRDLILTIDRVIQFLVEQKLAQAVEKFGAAGGTVIVMEPASGKILAMANYPVLEDEKTKNNPVNRAISETYEPGSVLKALTMSTGIDTGEVTPQTTFTDSGPIFVSGYKVDNWDGKHHGEESMIEVLQHSNNIGAAWVAQKLGAERLRSYFLKFGLGKPLGIDLEGEDTGIVKELPDWRPIDLATAAFGQGVSVTPLQLISIFSTIANGGRAMKPRVVSEIREGGKVIPISPKELRQVISPQTARVMVEMLTTAVEGGESKFYNLPHHKVAGKTGTAQIPVEGKYDPKKTNATFVGFLPSYPKFVILTLLRQPSSSVYAAETAVPLSMEIIKDLTVYYGIEPDK